MYNTPILTPERADGYSTDKGNTADSDTQEFKYWVKDNLLPLSEDRRVYEVCRNVNNSPGEQIMQCETMYGNSFYTRRYYSFTEPGNYLACLSLIGEGRSCGSEWNLSTNQQDLGNIAYSRFCRRSANFYPYFKLKISAGCNIILSVIIIAIFLIPSSFLFTILWGKKGNWAFTAVAFVTILVFWICVGYCNRGGVSFEIVCLESGEKIGRGQAVKPDAYSSITDIEITSSVELDKTKLMALTSLMIVGYLEKHNRQNRHQSQPCRR
eukprot:TRINITY_DN3620_c0_g1_i1.p1 TRINITY_DN3620_c0_g1~~TRINITY_DN3620_c0_g1_i1.p1  ORF type:complete len:267 (+),score=34.61 TRINITY_DN3620_c0_g1_i1:157-957(+)